MNKTIAASVLSAAMGLALTGMATAAQTAGQEKCFGIAAAGQNNCANAAAGHSCAGLSTTDYSGMDYKLVLAGTCTTMGGKTEAFQGVGTPA